MTKQSLKAESAYKNTHLVSQDLTERVRELLSYMPGPGDDERPINWGHVADLNEVNSLLSEIVATLSDHLLLRRWKRR